MEMVHSCDVHQAHGEVLTAYNASGILLSETSYRPFLHIASHSHEEEAYFNFVLSGGFTEHCGNRTYELSQSTLVYHAIGEERSNHFHNQSTRLFNVRLGAKWLRDLSDRTIILDASTCFTGGRLIELATRLYQEFRNIDTVSSLIIEGLTLEMLAEATRGSRASLDCRPPRWLTQVRELLHAQFHEKPRLSEIAANVGVHPAHLSRAFHQHFRCTIGDYIRRLRVEYACCQLTASETSLTDVASAAGFSDQSHFSRIFKRCTGQTPAQYRASFRSR